MNTLIIDLSYKRLALAVFIRAVLDARSKKSEFRLDALDWLNSVGYSWLNSWGFAIRHDEYDLFLEKLEPRSTMKVEEGRNEYAAQM